jgi:hypothetical protein
MDMMSIIDIDVDYFYLKMKDGKYHIYERTSIPRPRVITEEIEVVDTAEEAFEKTTELNRKQMICGL